MTKAWGGEWTAEKLEVLGKYLRAFQNALKNQKFQTFYIDALAGDGKGNAIAATPLFLKEDNESRESLRQGSAAIALATTPAFDQFRLNEISLVKAEALQVLVKNSSIDLNSVIVSSLDANEFVLQVLKELNTPKDRGVIVLDPFGLQIRWSTVVAIAETQKLDMWYLFPTEGLIRTLTTKDLPPEEWQPRLDLVLGNRDWRKEFYEISDSKDLLGSVQNVKRTANFDAVEAYVIKRLKHAFKGTVIDQPLRLGPKGRPKFSFCFASGNPSQKARELTKKLAQDIINANQPKLL